MNFIDRYSDNSSTFSRRVLGKAIVEFMKLEKEVALLRYIETVESVASSS
jgi:hypothetical protein